VRLLAKTARDPEIHALLLDMAADLEAEADALDRTEQARKAECSRQPCAAG
jgi:hypothetical protein